MSKESEKEETKISMKLLIDKTQRKVLFAEAGKDSVDFLFHILSLPLGTVVGYLSTESMAGSIGNIYGSLESIGNDYVEHRYNRDCLLNPKPAPGSASNIPLFTTKPGEPGSKKVYQCKKGCGSGYNNSVTYVSDCYGVKCPGTNCVEKLDQELSYVEDPEEVKKSRLGYVKGVVTYMITDDLCVKPMSTISTTAILNKSNVAAGSLEEREVSLDMKMGLAVLKASLMSKTVLTDVFLPKKVILLKTATK